MFEPLTAERFIEEYWPDRMLHVEASPERAPALFGMPELRDPLSLFHTHPQDVQLVFKADPSRPGSFGNVFLPPSKAAALYQSGMTASFPDMHRSIPSLGAVTQYLEQLTGVMPGTVDAIGALSRPGTGFHLHFDAIDVLVVQLHGTKLWRVSPEPAVRFPTGNHVAGTPLIGELRAYAPPESSQWSSDYVPPGTKSVLLKPGSMLFVPRGCWHHTEAGEDESFSISFGFRSPPLADLVLRELRRRLLAHADWRRPVSGGSGGPAHPTTGRMLRQLDSLLAGWNDAVGPLTARGLLPSRASFDSVAQVRQRMKDSFVPEAARSLALVAQFRLLADQRHEVFHVELADGALHMKDGEHPTPSLTISSSAADFLRFAADPAEGQALLTEGRLQVHPLDMEALGGLLASFQVFHTAT